MSVGRGSATLQRHADYGWSRARHDRRFLVAPRAFPSSQTLDSGMGLQFARLCGRPCLYGIAGGLFLGLGFAGQLVGNAGIGPALPLARTLEFSVVILIAGGLAAYVLFGLSFILCMTAIRRRVTKQPDLAELGTRWAWRPRVRRFWQHERVDQPFLDHLAAVGAGKY